MIFPEDCMLSTEAGPSLTELFWPLLFTLQDTDGIQQEGFINNNHKNVNNKTDQMIISHNNKLLISLLYMLSVRISD